MTIRLVPRHSSSTLRSAHGVGTTAALLAVCCVLAFVSACEDSAPPKIDPASMVPIEVTGRYQMTGVTTTPGSDLKRKIGGVMRIEQEGDHYKASYEFKTKFPGEGAPVDADVIGVGEGQIAGRTIDGTAHTQIVVSSVPGVDTSFAFAPRKVSARIVSSTTGEFEADGTLSIEIESRAEEGQTYRATRTRMRGRRIGDLKSMPQTHAREEARDAKDQGEDRDENAD